MKKFYINCPYSEKDLAKTLGARWDADAKKWFVPEGLNRNTFKRWWPKEKNTKPQIKLLK